MDMKDKSMTFNNRFMDITTGIMSWRFASSPLSGPSPFTKCRWSTETTTTSCTNGWRQSQSPLDLSTCSSTRL